MKTHFMNPDKFTLFELFVIQCCWQCCQCKSFILINHHERNRRKEIWRHLSIRVKEFFIYKKVRLFFMEYHVQLTYPSFNVMCYMDLIFLMTLIHNNFVVIENGKVFILRLTLKYESVIKVFHFLVDDLRFVLYIRI